MEHHALHDESIDQIIRRLAAQTARIAGLPRDAAEDIALIMRPHLWLQWDRFDPDRPDACRLKFAEKILGNLSIDLIRCHRAAKRNRNREAFSLDDHLSDSNGRTVARRDTLLECSHDPFDAIDFQLDLRDFFESLPEHLRAVFEAKRDGRVVELMNSPGWSRRIYDRRFQELIIACRDSGLDIYL